MKDVVRSVSVGQHVSIRKYSFMSVLLSYYILLLLLSEMDVTLSHYMTDDHAYCVILGCTAG